MEDRFLFVNVGSPTWLLYVALLIAAVFFRFRRPFAIRNLDLLLLLGLSTSLAVGAQLAGGGEQVSEAAEAAISDTVTIADRAGSEQVSENRAADVREVAATGSGEKLPLPADPESAELIANPAEPVNGGNGLTAWLTQLPLFVLPTISVLWIIRLLFDESFTRRPRLDQNLNHAGLTFLCIPAFCLLMLSVFLTEPSGRTMEAVETGQHLLRPSGSTGAARKDRQPAADDQPLPAPTETLLAAGVTHMARLSGQVATEELEPDRRLSHAERIIARVLAVAAHTVVVTGLLWIGYRHFASFPLGVAMSCLYLLLPCTAVYVHELSHILPAACLTWAVAAYRRPVVAGILLGLASGTLFFAAFLLPLWAVFYGRRGGVRFCLSLAVTAVILIGSLYWTAENSNTLLDRIMTTSNWTLFRLFATDVVPDDVTAERLFLRIPLAAVFFIMLIVMVVIPRARNLENLLANSTALIVAVQLWYPEDIGKYVLWYLPLLLLVIFRPRLDQMTPPRIPASASRRRRRPDSAGPAPAAHRLRPPLTRSSLYR